ncbi:hypothetical protein EWI07_13400 [Sporolactobacillus sp. THM7-4]|nr:hypothetical protein EWI07_13400 [Sporolactobacillus sp. THM7-4]
MIKEETIRRQNGLDVHELFYSIDFVLMKLDQLENKVGRKTEERIESRYHSYRLDLCLTGCDLEQIDQRLERLKKRFSSNRSESSMSETKSSLVPLKKKAWSAL